MKTKEDYAKVETKLNRSERNWQCSGLLRRLHNSLTVMFVFLGLFIWSSRLSNSPPYPSA